MKSFMASGKRCHKQWMKYGLRISVALMKNSPILHCGVRDKNLKRGFFPVISLEVHLVFTFQENENHAETIFVIVITRNIHRCATSAEYLPDMQIKKNVTANPPRYGLTRIFHKDAPWAASFSKSLRRKFLFLLAVSSGYAFVADCGEGGPAKSPGGAMIPRLRDAGIYFKVNNFEFAQPSQIMANCFFTLKQTRLRVPPTGPRALIFLIGINPFKKPFSSCF